MSYITSIPDWPDLWLNVLDNLAKGMRLLMSNNPVIVPDYLIRLTGRLFLLIAILVVLSVIVGHLPFSL